EVGPAAVRRKAPHRPLRSALETVLDHRHAAVAAEAPGVVLSRAQIKFLKRCDDTRAAAKKRLIEARLAVVSPKQQAKCMLGIVGASTISPADSETHIDLKSRRAVRIDQFHRRRTLPIAAILIGVGVDSRARVEEIRQVG